MRTQTWEISGEFWELVKPLIPTQKELRDETKEYKRNVGAGRKPKYDDRTYFSAIVYVLRTGIIWNALPRENLTVLVRRRCTPNFCSGRKRGCFIVFGKLGSANMTNFKG